MELAEELVSYKRAAIIREASKDLAETQVEKLTSLAESIDFESEASFSQKVATLKESYFSKEKPRNPIVEDTDASDDTEVNASPMMEQYLTSNQKSK